MTRLNKLICSVAVVAVGIVGFTGSASAAVINLTPANTIGQNLGPANCESGCVSDLFGPFSETLALLYKSDFNEGVVTGTDTGTYATSYTTTFGEFGDAGPPVKDPSGATISWNIGFPSISCPSCYLAIKDGAANPSYYFYDLAAWNGTSNIVMSGFWANAKGSISHVSIWGFPSDDPGGDVPEPATLALLGLGLLGAGFARRRSRSAR